MNKITFLRAGNSDPFSWTQWKSRDFCIVKYNFNVTRNTLYQVYTKENPYLHSFRIISMCNNNYIFEMKQFNIGIKKVILWQNTQLLNEKCLKYKLQFHLFQLILNSNRQKLNVKYDTKEKTN